MDMFNRHVKLPEGILFVPFHSRNHTVWPDWHLPGPGISTGSCSENAPCFMCFVADNPREKLESRGLQLCQPIGLQKKLRRSGTGMLWLCRSMRQNGLSKNKQIWQSYFLWAYVMIYKLSYSWMIFPFQNVKGHKCKIWGFPEMGVPPNHPFIDGFSMKPSNYWGIHNFWKSPFTRLCDNRDGGNGVLNECILGGQSHTFICTSRSVLDRETYCE